VSERDRDRERERERERERAHADSHSQPTAHNAYRALIEVCANAIKYA
jgi:hypothetical protein